MSNVAASPFMLVEGDSNLDTTEVQAESSNMCTNTLERLDPQITT